MKKSTQTRKKGLMGPSALFGAGILMVAASAVPTQAQAGEAEVAAGLLLGAALVIAADDGPSHRHSSPRVGYSQPYKHHHDKPNWKHRDDRRYCDVHARYHHDGAWHSHYYSGGKRYEHKHNDDRYSYYSRDDRGKYERDRYVYRDRDNGHSHHHGDARGEVRWNTRVRAY